VPEDPRFFVPYKTGDEAPFQIGVYHDYLKARKAEVDGAKAWGNRVAAAHAAGDSAGGLSGKVKLHAFPHVLNKTVEQLKARNLLPALFFTFARKKCEEYAELVSHSLVTGSEAAEIRRQVAFHLAPHRAVLEPLAQYHQVLKLAERGVAFHHSGLLPLLKEIVELLFSRGFIKVLFCTETFSIGLNMPARTVVFTDFIKPTENGMRPLIPEEYIQMGGRAGRRGKDKEGLVLYLPSREPVALEDMRAILGGGLATLYSRMAFHYDFALKALHKRPDLTQTLLTCSYGAVQRETRKVDVDAQVVVLTARLAALGLTDAERATAAEKAELDHAVATTRRGAHKKATEALAAWTAVHGATWPARKARLEEERGLVRKREDLVAESEGCAAANDARRFEPVLQSLVAGGYAVKKEESYALTPMGILATECNEANPLLLSYLYESGLLKGARVEEIVGILGAFVVDHEAVEKSKSPKELAISDRVRDLLYTLGEWGQESLDGDDAFCVQSPPEYWCLTTLWVEILTRWLQGATATELCARHDLMEGNLMKGVLKVANIVREWKTMATVRADVDMLATLDGVELLLLKGIAIPESLYLRI
jgi:superfamily II RNA helicase